LSQADRRNKLRLPSDINHNVHVDYSSVGKTQECRYIIYSIYIVYVFQISEQKHFLYLFVMDRAL